MGEREMSTLKNCPFCGGEAVLGKMPKFYFVYCRTCGVSTDNSSRANVVAEWNRRVAPPSSAPDGWVLVPREPTPEMVDAIPLGQPTGREIYRAMISAAPAAPNGWCNIQDDPPPKDGRWILATNIGWHGDCEVLGWHFGAWRKTPSPESGEYTITHWMPLPAAPAEARDE